MLENNEISPVWLQNPKIFILFMTFESLNYSVMQLVIYFSATYYIPDFIYVPNSTHPRLEVGEFMFPVMFLCILVAYFFPFLPSLRLSSCRSRVQQPSPVRVLRSLPRHGQRSEVTGAVQSQSRRPTTFTAHQPAPQRRLQCSHRRWRRGSEEGLWLNGGATVDRKRQQQSLRWAALLY